MADKILRIVFSGISTLTPGPPRGGTAPPQKAFVLMAANRKKRKNQFDDPIEVHTPFIYVPRSILADPIPPPAEVVADKNLGPCNIYFIDHARIMVDKTPLQSIQYFTDPKHDLDDAERPGSDNVACENDIRWLADLRDVLPKRAALREKADEPAIGDDVAAIVELRGGTLKANFPCKSVQPKTFSFKNKDGTKSSDQVVKGFKRVLASEFFVDMPFLENTTTVKLSFYPLRKGDVVTGIEGNELTLQWGAAIGIEVRMGNDTKDEAKVLTSTKRCDARARDNKGKPLLVPRDADFDLHYDLLNIPPDEVRPLPTNGPHQTHVDGCSPGTGG